MKCNRIASERFSHVLDNALERDVLDLAPTRIPLSSLVMAPVLKFNELKLMSGY